MKYLQIQAGPSAYQTINEHGLSPSLFSAMLGASGGPKWFTLLGLDRYLFGDFFSDLTSPIQLIGSSAGAFRFAALAQQNPVVAIERLAQHYSTMDYQAKPSQVELSQKGFTMVDVLLGDNGADEILNNPLVKANFITAKTNGMLASENKYAQLAGLLTSYGLNRIDRKLLNKQYQRVTFGSDIDNLIINDPHNINSSFVKLSHDNLVNALLASGSIPMVLQGIKDIAGAPSGIYRDGGIIDYHFDFTVSSKNHPHNLVLFPHFSAQPRAGWFDKSLRRTPKPSSFDNVVLLSPTPEFIRQLPYSKIPDRKDFENIEVNKRQSYWQQVLSQSQLLADEFAAVVNDQRLDQIKPLLLR